MKPHRTYLLPLLSLLLAFTQPPALMAQNGDTEIFAAAASGDDFDLQDRDLYMRWTGTGYQFTSDRRSRFHTDPTGHASLLPGFGADLNDGFATITLTGGEKVSLYGVSYGAVHVGANGYITFAAGDTAAAATAAAHFSQPRIAAFFTDLNPGAGAPAVRWAQLSDRLVVTFEEVRQTGTLNENHFQVELFLDSSMSAGLVRVTWTRVDSGTGSSPAVIVGLSDGSEPAQLVEDDFSASALESPGNVYPQGFASVLGIAGSVSSYNVINYNYQFIINAPSGVPGQLEVTPSAPWVDGMATPPASGLLFPGPNPITAGINLAQIPLLPPGRPFRCRSRQRKLSGCRPKTTRWLTD